MIVYKYLARKSVRHKSATDYGLLGDVFKTRFHAPPTATQNYVREVYTMRYQYDLWGRLSEINKLDYYYTNQDHFGARYTYNKIGLLTEASYLNPGISNNPNASTDFLHHKYRQQYVYDNLNRLLESQYVYYSNYSNSLGYYDVGQFKERLSYDANGNIRSLERRDQNGSLIDNLIYNYQNGNNQLSSLSENAAATSFKWDGESVNRFVYDANGNLLCDTGLSTNVSCGANVNKTDPLQQITYDERDLPLTFQKDGQTITYRYNAAGQRIYKKVMGAQTIEEHYIMNGSELVAVVNGSGNLQFWQTAWGRYEKNGTNFTTYYYLGDHLGSTRVVLSESGQRVEAADYYAFGLKMPTRSAVTSTKHWNTGKERDFEIKLSADSRSKRVGIILGHDTTIPVSPDG